jgi:hypothetical protein
VIGEANQLVTPEYKYGLLDITFLFSRLDFKELLVWNAVFELVCLNNLVTKVVSLPV